MAGRRSWSTTEAVQSTLGSQWSSALQEVDGGVACRLVDERGSKSRSKYGEGAFCGSRVACKQRQCDGGWVARKSLRSRGTVEIRDGLCRQGKSYAGTEGY